MPPQSAEKGSLGIKCAASNSRRQTRPGATCAYSCLKNRLSRGFQPARLRSDKWGHADPKKKTRRGPKRTRNPKGKNRAGGISGRFVPIERRRLSAQPTSTGNPASSPLVIYRGGCMDGGTATARKIRSSPGRRGGLACASASALIPCS